MRITKTNISNKIARQKIMEEWNKKNAIIHLNLLSKVGWTNDLLAGLQTRWELEQKLIETRS